VGDATHCAVSGAVFVIEESSPKAEADGKPVYFCCGSCEAYFQKHRDEVLAKRGWVRTGSGGM
jgi:YHS domain-containing protein